MELLRKNILLLLLFLSFALNAQDTTKVFVFDIRAEIDPRMSRHVELALQEAKDQNADLVIVDMDTYGGALPDADKIRTLFMNFELPIHSWVNNNAASAGALISIATDSIYMAPGSSIGAATVVDASGVPAPDKYQSYMRTIMRTTAEHQGRDPDMAQKMVGDPTEEGGVGRVLSLSTSEAINADFADGVATSIEDVLKHLEVEEYEVVRYEKSSIEGIVTFFLHPIVQSVLLLLMMGGLYFELQTPGVGFPLAAAVIAAVLYFLPNYITGLAETWEIIIVIVGVGMVIAEFFVIPGFGILGISGIVLIVSGMMLALLNNDAFDFRFVPAEDVTEALTIVAAGVFGGIIVIFAAAGKFMESAAFRKISGEDDTFQSKEGYHSTFHKEELKGKEGVTYTILRPSGKVKIGDTIHNAHSSGEWIDRGRPVIVTDARGGSLKVMEKESES